MVVLVTRSCHGCPGRAASPSPPVICQLRSTAGQGSPTQVPTRFAQPAAHLSCITMRLTASDTAAQADSLDALAAQISTLFPERRPARRHLREIKEEFYLNSSGPALLADVRECEREERRSLHRCRAVTYYLERCSNHLCNFPNRLHPGAVLRLAVGMPSTCPFTMLATA